MPVMASPSCKLLLSCEQGCHPQHALVSIAGRVELPMWAASYMRRGFWRPPYMCVLLWQCRRGQHSSLAVAWLAMACWSVMGLCGGGSASCPTQLSARQLWLSTQEALTGSYSWHMACTASSLPHCWPEVGDDDLHMLQSGVANRSKDASICCLVPAVA